MSKGVVASSLFFFFFLACGGECFSLTKTVLHSSINHQITFPTTPKRRQLAFLTTCSPPTTTTTLSTTFLILLKSSSRLVEDCALFDEDEEDDMMPITENYLRAKYNACAIRNDRDYVTKEDAKDLLQDLLPPVTPAELQKEVDMAVATMSVQDGDEKKVNVEDFIRSVIMNSYWAEAGPLVVKELMYFDALYSYYKTGQSLLNDEDYGELKESLTWEGSSVATMTANEALFVTAIASSRRGKPIMDDEEYAALKSKLKKENSWVTERGQDALEKLGLDTFLGYLHRAL